MGAVLVKPFRDTEIISWLCIVMVEINVSLNARLCPATMHVVVAGDLELKSILPHGKNDPMY